MWEVIDFVSSQIVGLGDFESQVSFYFLGGVVAWCPTSFASGGDLECHKFTMSVVE